MTWNYRLCRRTIGDDYVTYGVREVYYDENGEPEGWTDVIDFSGDTPGEVRRAMKLALRDINERPILDIGKELP